MHALRALLQKPPCVVAVVKFCVYFDSFTIMNDTISRGNVLLCVFGDCVLTGHRQLLCDALDCCSHCVVVLRRAFKL